MNPFAPLQNIITDAATLIASLVALGVTILAFRLGRAWIIKITTDAEDRENFEEFKESEMDDKYHDMVQDDLF